MLEVIENVYYPMTIGGEAGTIALPENVEFKPDDYRFDPLLNGEIVLAVPIGPAGSSRAVCHLFTRQVWSGSPARTKHERGFPAGVVWYHHTELDLTLETVQREDWPDAQRHLTVAIDGPLGGVTTVTEERTKVTRPT